MVLIDELEVVLLNLVHQLGISNLFLDLLKCGSFVKDDYGALYGLLGNPLNAVHLNVILVDVAQATLNLGQLVSA
jgi:hypothetical protein